MVVVPAREKFFRRHALGRRKGLAMQARKANFISGAEFLDRHSQRRRCGARLRDVDMRGHAEAEPVLLKEAEALTIVDVQEAIEPPDFRRQSPQELLEQGGSVRFPSGWT